MSFLKRPMVGRIKALRAGILLAGGLTLSSSALSLVLGDIMLSSALNEPLEAVIELDSLEGIDAADIMVTIGDQQAYDRVNIERPPFLDNISFSVEVDDAEEGRIRLSSTDLVTEPFLNLIVAVSEPGGVTLREYTLLLELPAESEVSQAPVAGDAAAAPAEVAAAGTYTVGAGDTLYEIAQNTRPDASIGVEQMMVAIQRANTDAFIGGNINRLISGRVLRIPAQQDIEVIDQRSAVAQVTQQNSALGGQPLAAGAADGGAGNGSERDQLRVLSGDATAGAGGGSSDLAATIAALENELMLSEESLDRARIENLELTNRLAALQEQIDLLENIIAIEDERIAQLQTELAEQAAATEQALASAATSAAALEEVNSEAPSTLTEWLRTAAVGLGALVVLIALVLGFLVLRRRREAAAAEASSYNPAFADDTVVIETEKPGLVAGLLARFRRNKDEDEDDYTDEEADAIVAAQSAPAVMAAVPQAVPAPKKNSTDNLLDEMGINEDMMSLDDALDGIDDAHSADTFEPVRDDVEEPGAAVVEVVEVNTETPAQRADDDYALTAAAAAFAAVDKDAVEVLEAPEVTEFTTAEVATPVSVPAEAVPHDSAETFEFKLKELPEIDSAAPAPAAEKIETFDFKLGATPAPQPAPAAAAQDEALEVIAFPGASAKPAAPQQSVAQEDDLSLELGDISFDDTMLGDDAEEESPYKPRTGNECDTKLDLATAYEAMGDVVEAIEILDEVIAEGSPSQVETAQRLKETWQASL